MKAMKTSFLHALHGLTIKRAHAFRGLCVHYFRLRSSPGMLQRGFCLGCPSPENRLGNLGKQLTAQVIARIGGQFKILRPLAKNIGKHGAKFRIAPTFGGFFFQYEDDLLSG
jgi:hypothetical protein